MPPGDEHALADAIERVIQDPIEAATLREGGLQRVRERFDVRRQGVVLAELFRQMRRRTSAVAVPEEAISPPIEVDPETESSCMAARVPG